MPMPQETVEEKPSEIVFDTFTKIDIRVGMIAKAERIPKSEKLLKLEIDFGSLGLRQIVAGIGRDYAPEALLGIQILAVVNLVPRAVFGVDSHGMILCAKHEDGGLILGQCIGAKLGARLG
jgi:methionyl-tRNA synthetase